MSEKVELADILAQFHKADGWKHEPKKRGDKPLRIFELINRLKRKEQVTEPDLVLVVGWLHDNWERYNASDLFRMATMEARWTVARRREESMAKEKVDTQLGARSLFKMMSERGIRIPE